MIDFHCHILPSIDDGPKSIEDAVNLLEAQRAQGVKKVIATSHFYPKEMSLDSFIEKRDEAVKNLKQAMPENINIEIHTGAEVYCDNFLLISKDFSSLCIEGTSLFLLELPVVRKWPKYVWKILDKLINDYSLTVIIAHAERYPQLRKRSSKYIRRLVDMGCIIQVNCKSVYDVTNNDLILKWIDNEYVHLLGSDCHDTTKRPPDLKKANEYLSKIYGVEIVSYFQSNAKKLLSGSSLQDNLIFF